MELLYNSDSYAVVQFDAAQEDPPNELPNEALRKGGGYEIVDKFARKEIYLQGALADSFRRGVQALVEAESNAETFDEFIGGWTQLAQQPLTLH